MRQPLLPVALAIAGLTIVTGCSARKLVYGYLDTVLYRSVDSTFDVDATQKALLEPRLDALHAWHAREELPRYAADLEELESRAADGVLDKADMDWFYDRLDGARARLVERAMPDAVAFLGTVGPAQITRLERKNAERNKEREGRLAEGEEEFVERRSDSFEKNMRPWLGSVSREQRARIEAFARAAWPLEPGRLEAAKESQKRFTGMLARKPTAAGIEAVARQGLRPLDPAKNPYQARIRDLVAEIAALATPAQKAHFAKEVRAWRADFMELHRKYGTAAGTVGDAGTGAGTGAGPGAETAVGNGDARTLGAAP